MFLLIGERVYVCRQKLFDALIVLRGKHLQLTMFAFRNLEVDSPNRLDAPIILQAIHKTGFRSRRLARAAGREARKSFTHLLSNSFTQKSCDLHG